MNSMNTFDNAIQSNSLADLEQNDTIIYHKVGDSFRCAKCHSTNCDYEIIQMQPDGISSLMHKKGIPFKSISCTDCGYTEFFKVKAEKPMDPLKSIDFND